MQSCPQTASADKLLNCTDLYRLVNIEQTANHRKRKKVYPGDIVVIKGQYEIIAETEELGMKIQQISLINFRNYQNLNLRIDGLVNVYGNNAQGKTNILESIFYSAFGMSHRTGNEDDLVVTSAAICSAAGVLSRIFMALISCG